MEESIADLLARIAGNLSAIGDILPKVMGSLFSSVWGGIRVAVSFIILLSCLAYFIDYFSKDKRESRRKTKEEKIKKEMKRHPEEER